MEVIVFDIWGDFAHFKKFYTTSSPLTFSFPPPPTLKGMLGAIIGADKKEYLDIFSRENCKIALKIINPIKKVRYGLNHINTKGGYWVPLKKKNHEARTQIRTEFVKSPKYRVYVFHKSEEIFDKLRRNLENHESFFTLSLGLSELLADFELMGIFNFQEKQNCDNVVEIDSVIPVDVIKDYGIVFEENKKYFKERIPLDMDIERVVEKYEDVVFEAEGNIVKANVQKYWEGTNGERIIFF
ncbi:type I-B CRISPR-associated protein Cas5b [Thermovenabulum sp.]|uniref:type I-B CRISPR-associated protein Cas5b n=1 Tax=Thermovenabulum sp. TaxID=3100335 RepID=UPI003C7A1F2A